MYNPKQMFACIGSLSSLVVDKYRIRKGFKYLKKWVHIIQAAKGGNNTLMIMVLINPFWICQEVYT